MYESSSVRSPVELSTAVNEAKSLAPLKKQTEQTME